MALWELFYIFAKIGLFTFGGGYAMIPIIENICVEEKKWITHDEMMNLTVIAESTPGPIAINCATFIGYRKSKLLGSVVATIGMVLPSLVIIYLISQLLDNFLEITWVAHALSGIKVAVGILIVDAAIKMIKKMKKSALSVAFLIVACAVMLAVDVLSIRFSSIYLMVAIALISLIVFTISNSRKTSSKTKKAGDSK